MKDPTIAKLLEHLKKNYGSSLIPYGTGIEEENGTGFRIAGIQATFSVLVSPGMPPGEVDVQIENYPPGEYLYTTKLPVERFIQLIDEYRKPLEQWPEEGNGA